MLNEIHCGDVRTELRKWPTGFVQCVVTSPPYWGLRDYGVAGQLGLEKTPDEYVANMVDVFREVRRVLRDDGTCWLNLGDSYAVAGGAGKQGKTGQRAGRRHTAEIASKSKIIPRGSGRWGGGNVFAPGLKAKDLVGIPWRVALALQADGWYLRADVIWAKKNCMPESVEDRPTRAHEYIFLLTKNPIYFYDAEAIKEKGDIPAGTRAAKGGGEKSMLNKHTGVNYRPPEYWDYTGYRNKRSWWPMSTHPFPEAHFATFPPELPRTCILAGTSEAGACPACYAPWRRVVRKEGGTTGRGWNDHTANLERGKRTDTTTRQGKGTDGSYRVTTIGWERTCKCTESYCPKCCIVINLKPDEKHRTTQRAQEKVCDLQDALSRSTADEPVLQSGVSCGLDRKTQEDDDRENHHVDRLRPLVPTGASECHKDGLHSGTSVGHGESPTTTTEPGRDCASSKRKQTGQRTRKSGIDAQADARPSSKTNQASHSTSVSPLPGTRVPDDTCPHCGSILTERPTSTTRPSIVLDPFMGAGTTALAALQLDRDFIGVELNPEYVKMATRRTAAEMAQMRLFSGACKSV